MVWLYLIIVVVGIFASRIALVAGRGHYDPRGIVTAAIGLAATLLTISLIVWGFMYLDWYWPIIGFVVGTIAGVAVNHSTFPALIAIAPILELGVIAGAAYLWFWA